MPHVVFTSTLLRHCQLQAHAVCKCGFTLALQSVCLGHNQYPFMQAHNHPQKCIHCAPVMLNGYGIIRPYTLAFGAYKTVMHGQYHHATAPDKGKRSYVHRSDHWLEKNSCPSSRPQIPPEQQAVRTVSDKSRTARGDHHHGSMSLDQWITQLGLGHYRPMLTGLTLAQVLSMDARMLQEVGVITSSAIRRIQFAIDNTKSASK